jgi:glycine hydroxymethyltransferase
MAMKKKKIADYIKQHETLRSDGINLVVSENHLSDAVRAALSSDLAGRYYAEWYGGASTARKIVEATEELAKELFKAEYALVHPLSGNLCDAAALLAFTREGDKAAILPFETGGYPFGLEKFNRKRVDLPVKKGTLDIDVKAAKKALVEEKVKLAYLGASSIPFPHPVKEISSHMKKELPEAACVFDGSHVLGLIATGTFQDPLREGAHVLMGSTHKTFPGPQGGLILTNSEAHYQALRRWLDFDLEGGFGLEDNPHVNRIAALGIALEEMLEEPDYGQRVVENAKALAQALDDAGLPVRFKDRGYTESHQVHLDLSPEKAEALCRSLEEAGIFIDIGARVGTAEVTRHGMGVTDMKKIAARMADVYLRDR